MEHDIDIDIDRTSPTIEEALDDARVSVTRFPPASSWVLDEVLERSGLPKGSLLATLLRKSDGLLLDRAWVRILGVTAEGCGRTLAEWNDPAGWRQGWGEGLAGMLCFADDPAGNQFAINLGEDGSGNWQVHVGWYDSRAVTSLEMTFGQWFEAAVAGKHAEWYPAALWEAWQELHQTVRIEPHECWSVSPRPGEPAAWKQAEITCRPAAEVLALAPDADA